MTKKKRTLLALEGKKPAFVAAYKDDPEGGSRQANEAATRIQDGGQAAIVVRRRVRLVHGLAVDTSWVVKWV